MKITCGTDIIEIERVKESIENVGTKFIERVYTEKEIEYCESRKKQKYQHYAGRFAAKEAAFKAISKILDDKYSVCWKDFETINDGQGRPSIILHNINTEKIESIDVSISHCKEYAIANVVILFK
ncbi:holo-[acyl-carrier-protein] synthase [Clostridium sp. CAG:470]|jgi:holo-[acyl-carrier-protein] synthase|nr:MAG: holo-[acyl-carrier-protein] synthase [Clostridium sp. 28_17]CDE14428.1 holo-[acyl-carrier-protein] synthase [Clostridium sp. CAG:470]